MFKEKNIFYILCLAFISFFNTLWIRKADLMESRNFISAREIIVNNEWLVTTLNGEYRFEKPPLPTWLTAFVMKSFNNFSDEWLLRIPVALSCILLVYFMYKLVEEFSQNKNIAFLCSFVLTTTFMITKVGSENSWDAYPYIFMFISIFYLIKMFKSEKIKYLLLGSLFLSFSLLSKGPVALYGMFLPFIISYLFIYKGKELRENKYKCLLYFFIGVGIASIWPIAMIWENKDLFFAVMSKEKNTWSNDHVKSVFFYLHYFGYMGSWALFTALLFLKKWKFKNEKENQLFKFSLLWSILSLILLSLIKMKKERYGFPIYIISAIPIGIILNYYLNKKWEMLRKFDRIIFYLQSFLIGIICIASIGLIYWEATFLGKIILPIPFYFMGIIIIKNYFHDKNNFKTLTIYCSGLILLLINCNVAWIIEKYISGTPNNEWELLESLQTSDKQLPIYSNKFSIEDVWSVGQTIKTFGLKKALSKELPESLPESLPEEFYILSKDLNLSKQYTIVSQKDYYRHKNEKEIISLYRVKRIE